MNDDLVTVYEAESFPIAELIHQRLADRDIEAFVERTASPFDGLNTMGQCPHIQVRRGDLNAARTIVESFLAEQSESA